MNGPGSGSGAVGILIAYEDLDGNGQLTMTQSGPLSDRVLGTSISDHSPLEPSTSDQYAIYFLTAAQGPLAAGFNLVRHDNATPSVPFAVLPLDTSLVELPLSGDPRLGLFICAETYDFFSSASNLACGIERFSTPTLSAFGFIMNGNLSFSVSWMKGLTPAPGQQGSLNGHALTLTTVDAGTFSVTSLNGNGPEADWLVAGTNTLVVSSTDPAWMGQTLPFQVLAPFQITAPQAGPFTAPLTVSWTASAGAVEYIVTLGRADGSEGTTPLTETVHGTTFTFQSLPAGSGPILLTVQADSFDSMNIGMSSSPQVNMSRIVMTTLQ